MSENARGQTGIRYMLVLATLQLAVTVFLGIPAYDADDTCAAGNVQSGGVDGNVRWEVSGDTLTLTSVSGSATSMKDYQDTRPPWQGFDVSNAVVTNIINIGQWAFCYNTSIRTVTLDEYCTTIGDRAFDRCQYLESVNLGHVQEIWDGAFFWCIALKSVDLHSCTHIGVKAFSFAAIEQLELSTVGFINQEAFSYCSKLKSLVLNNAQIVEDGAFKECGLESVQFDSKLTDIGKGAFSGCMHLEQVTIPSSVELIGDGCFSDCSSLCQIDVQSGNAHFRSVNGVLFDSGITRLIQYPAGKPDRTYVIPATVSNVGEHAFSGCSLLESITIPGSVVSLGTGAFRNCTSLKSLTMPININAVGNNLEPLFKGVARLDSVHLTRGASQSGYDYLDDARSDSYYQLTPWNCSRNTLTVVDVQSGVDSIGSNQFRDCYYVVTSSVQDSVTKIGAMAFSECRHMTSVNLSWARYVGDGAFADTRLTSVSFSGVLDYLGQSAFENCTALKAVSFGNSPLKAIGDKTFNNTALAAVQVPSGVTEIGMLAFGSCQQLKSVTLGPDTVSIGRYAFSQCVSLESFAVPSKVSVIQAGTFSGCTSLTAVSMPDGLKSVEDKAFYDCSRLSGIGFGSGLEHIGEEAFCNCINLASVTFREPQMTSIANYAFYKCTSLKAIDIPGGVTGIGNHQFSGCSSMTDVTIPSSVSSLGYGAFRNCTHLTHLTVPISLNTVVDAQMPVFEGCTHLRSLRMIGSGLGFDYDDSPSSGGYYRLTPWYLSRDVFTTLEIADGINEVGDYTFKGCHRISDLTISISTQTATNANRHQFEGCTGIEKVTFTPGKNGQGAHYSESCYRLTPWYQSRYTCDVIEIPDGVTTIGSYMFAGSHIGGTLVLPTTVATIYHEAFYGCQMLEHVYLPANLTTLYTSFERCSSLQSIDVDPGNPVYKSIDGVLFQYRYGDLHLHAYPQGRAEADYRIPSGVVGIDIDSFLECNLLKSVTIPDTVKEIQQKAFCNCINLATVEIPISLNSTGTQSDSPQFTDCTNIEKVILSKGSGVGFDYQQSGRAAYSLTPWYLSQVDVEVVIGEGITRIGDMTFRDCDNLAALAIGRDVKSIGKQVFVGCTGIRSLTLPISFDPIGSNQNPYFKDTKSLKQVVFTPESPGAHSFDYSNDPDAGNYYRLTPWYLNKANSPTVTIREGVYSVGDYAFASLDTLGSIVLPDRLGRIGSNAFYDCSGLKIVTAPIDLDLDYYKSFEGCYNIEKFVFTKGIGGIGYVYSDEPGSYNYYQNSLMYHSRAFCQEVVFTDTVRTIGQYMFAGCTWLNLLTIGTMVRSIDETAFKDTFISTVYYNSRYLPLDTASPCWDGLPDILFIAGNYGTVSGSFLKTGHADLSSVTAFRKEMVCIEFNTKADGSGEHIPRNTTDYTYSGRTAVYAVWSDGQYQLQFDANGGKGFMPDQIVYWDYAQNLNPNEFTRDGWTFVGWNTDPSATTALYTDGQEVLNIGSGPYDTVRLYAVWTWTVPESVTVVPSSVVLYPSERIQLAVTTYPESAAPAVFQSTAKDIIQVSDRGVVTALACGKGQVTVSVYGVSATVDVKVMERPEIHTVVFDGNGGVPQVGSLNTDDTGRLPYIPDAARQYYTLDGWYTAAEGGEEITPATVFKQDVTVYAHWIQNVPEKVYVKPLIATLFVGDSRQMSVSTVPETSLPVTWTSDNPDIVAVDADGKITALAYGRAMITATVAGVRGSAFAVQFYHAVDVTFDGNGGIPQVVSLSTGSSGTLPYVPDATRQYYTFDGWYTAAEGGERITADTVFRQNTTVYAHWIQNVPGAVIVTPPFVALRTGQSAQLSAFSIPETQLPVAWESLQPTVVSVDSDGRVTAHAVGSAVIRATIGGVTGQATIIVVTEGYIVTFDGNGGVPGKASDVTDTQGRLSELPAAERPDYEFAGWYTAAEGGEKITLDRVYTGDTTVYAHWNVVHVTGVEVTPAEAEIMLGRSLPLKATVLPLNATDKNVTWVSEDIRVATVDADGVVTAVSVGETVVTVTTDDGYFIAQCAVTVVPGSYTVTFDGNGGTPEVGSLSTDVSGKLPYIPLAGRQSYIFSGWYTAVEGGSQIGTETVFSEDTTVYARWSVIPVEKIVLNEYYVTLYVGFKSHKVTATVYPEEATFKDVSWTVSDVSVQTVADGVISPVKAGVTTVIAYIGDVRAVCNVTVKDAYDEVVPKLDETGDEAIIINVGEVVEQINVLCEQSRTPYLNISAGERESVVLTAEVVRALYAAEGIFDTSTPSGYLFLDDESLPFMLVGGGDATLRIRSTDVDSCLNCVAVVDFALLDGGSVVPVQFPSFAELGIKYEMHPWELDDYAVYYIPDSGEPVRMEISGYEDGYVYFYTDHFSTYALVYEGSDHPAVDVIGVLIGILLVLVPLTAVVGIEYARQQRS